MYPIKQVVIYILMDAFSLILVSKSGAKNAADLG
jgi:hypothetical protein